MPMNPDLEKLVRLHQADTELKRVEAELAEIPDAAQGDRGPPRARARAPRRRPGGARRLPEGPQAARGRRPGPRDQALEVQGPAHGREDQQGIHGHAPRDRGRGARHPGPRGPDPGGDGEGRGPRRRRSSARRPSSRRSRRSAEGPKAELDARAAARGEARAARGGARRAWPPRCPRTAGALRARREAARPRPWPRRATGCARLCHVKLRPQMWVELKQERAGRPVPVVQPHPLLRAARRPGRRRAVRPGSPRHPHRRREPGQPRRGRLRRPRHGRPTGAEVAALYGYLGHGHQQRGRVPGAAPRPALRARAGAPPGRVFSDSELVVRQIEGRYRVKHPGHACRCTARRRASSPASRGARRPRAPRAEPRGRRAGQPGRGRAGVEARASARDLPGCDAGREADEADHPAGALPVAPVGVVEVGAAARAVGDVVDAPRAQAGVRELADVGGAHVEVGPAARAGAEERRARRAEGLAQLVAHLVAAGADAGPERGHQVVRPRAPRDERAHGRARPRPPRSRASRRAPPRPTAAAGPRAAPAGSRRSRCRGASPGASATAASASGVPVPGRRRRPRRRGPASAGGAARRRRGPRPRGARVSSRVSASRAGRPPLEAVDEPGDASSAGTRRGAQRHPGHPSSGAATTLNRWRSDPVEPTRRRERRRGRERASSIVAIEEAEAPAGRRRTRSVFSAGELAYARARVGSRRGASPRGSPPSGRRSGCSGPGALEREVEVVRGRLRPAAAPAVGRGRASGSPALGATRALVSLTHERRHAAALVLLLRGGA